MAVTGQAKVGGVDRAMAGIAVSRLVFFLKSSMRGWGQPSLIPGVF